jgi:asparagine synthase (glutamine-hydrolysing)
MCGLAGRFHPELLPDAPGWSERADRLLAHRGPDGAGCFSDRCCELVHRRLALVDLSPTGHQPMANEDGTVVVVFNGEIYNHRELRRSLQSRGHAFRGTSDTEVLVHLYEERRHRLVEELRGIFAFAIYDRARRSLLLGRDRFGVKPLYYASVGDQWVFASEIKAIAAVPGLRLGLDRQACFDFLGLGYVPEPATGFLEITALSPGTTLMVTPDGQRLASYTSPAARPDPALSLPEAADEVAERLLAAVSGQAVADVLVAALLSGGIDSSLVVAAHRRATGAGVTTFSVRFPDPRFDETGVARAVAEHCDTEHHVIDPAERSLDADAVLGLLRHFDQPFADPSLIPTFWVSAAVRERGIVCALSGDGGDETFGGYARFWRAGPLFRLSRSPWAARWAAGKLGLALSGWTRDSGRRLHKAAKLADAGRHDAALLLAGFAAYLNEDEKADLVSPEARRGLWPTSRLFELSQPRAARDLEDLSRRITDSLFAVSLPSDMLRKVDMMSMRAGIEVRVPLLDEEVVALGMSLPHRLKTDGRRGKLVLRELAERWLPHRVARHPKHGFSIPLDVMVGPGFHRAAEDLLLGPDARTRPFRNEALARGWLAAFRRSGAGNGRRVGKLSRGGLIERVLMLVSLELFLRDHRLTW